MKQKFLKKNCPRIARAIREAVLIVGRRSYWFGNNYYHSDVGRMVYELGLKADKYDVLNALCPGIQGEVITYARGDIRRRKHRLGCDSIAIYITLLLLVVVVVLLSGVW